MGLRQSLTTEQSLDSTITAEDRALYKHAKNIQQILKGAKTVAMVGLSNKPERPSNFVASYFTLREKRIARCLCNFSI